MSDGFHLLDIVFFAMVAAFLVLRLRNVLGRRTGEERRPPDWTRGPAAGKPADNVIDLAAARKSAAPEPVSGPPGLQAIRAADPSFSTAEFLNGARAAFEMIVGAFAAGDTRTLRPLLSDEVYRNFSAAIDARTRAGEHLLTELMSIRSAEVVEARLDGTAALVTVRFASSQINAVEDAQGQVVDGSRDRITDVVDDWTFRRDVRSPDPNWELVATRTPEG